MGILYHLFLNFALKGLPHEAVGYFSLVLQISKGNLTKLQKVGDLLSVLSVGASSHSKQIIQVCHNFLTIQIRIYLNKGKGRFATKWDYLFNT